MCISIFQRGVFDTTPHTSSFMASFPSTGRSVYNEEVIYSFSQDWLRYAAVLT